MSAPYYRTIHWRRLRARRLAMDNYVCVVPGCGQRAVVVDHVRSRNKGGADTVSNLRSLCRQHDNQIKERSNGKRAKNGVLTFAQQGGGKSRLGRQRGTNRRPYAARPKKEDPSRLSPSKAAINI
jgi:hypothetical protein